MQAVNNYTGHNMKQTNKHTNNKNIKKEGKFKINKSSPRTQLRWLNEGATWQMGHYKGKGGRLK